MDIHSLCMKNYTCKLLRRTRKTSDGGNEVPHHRYRIIIARKVLASTSTAAGSQGLSPFTTEMLNSGARFLRWRRLCFMPLFSPSFPSPPPKEMLHLTCWKNRGETVQGKGTLFKTFSDIVWEMNLHLSEFTVDWVTDSKVSNKFAV